MPVNEDIAPTNGATSREGSPTRGAADQHHHRPSPSRHHHHQNTNEPFEPGHGPSVTPPPALRPVDNSELVARVEQAAIRPFDATSVVSMDDLDGSFHEDPNPADPVQEAGIVDMAGRGYVQQDSEHMTVHKMLEQRHRLAALQSQQQQMQQQYGHFPSSSADYTQSQLVPQLTPEVGTAVNGPSNASFGSPMIPRTNSLGNISLGSFAPSLSNALPPNQRYSGEVLRIARQMRGLSETDFLHLADLTHKRAWRNVYSLLEYRGTSWYLPMLRPVEDDEPSRGVGYTRGAGVWIALFGWRLELQLAGYVTRLVLLVSVWLALWSSMPERHLELSGFVFDPIVAVLFSAITGGILARLFRLPPLVTILWMGILWGNVPNFGYFTDGIDKYVRKAAGTFGLTVILIRAGLYIKPGELKPMLLPFVLFSFLPAIAELVVHSSIAKAAFGYESHTWAYAHGALVSVVSPAVVVPSLLQLRLDSFGITEGPGPMMMPAAPTEMVAGIWNINFMAQLAMDTGDVPLWLNVLLGPLQIIGGALVGVILGVVHFLSLKVFLAEAQKLPHRTYTQEHQDRVGFISTTMITVLTTATMAYTKSVNLGGGGAVATTVCAMTTAALIRRRSHTVYFDYQFKSLCMHTSDLWDLFTMPMLFAIVGTGIDLGAVFTADFFPKMLGCIAAGLAARMLVALAVTFRRPFTIGERAVMAVGWCGKASVQAALGSVFLDRAEEVYDTVAETDPALAERYLSDARQIGNAGVLMILLCAPVASLFMVRLGPKLLRKEGVPATPFAMSTTTPK